MNLYCYDNKRIYTFYQEAREILSGKIPRPRMALVYPSRACNQSCYYCSDRWDNNKIHAFMPTDKFLKLPVNLKKLGVESCELCGGGEPLLHPNIKEFIKECVKRKIKIASLTNGTMIKGELLNLIVRNFSYIRVSIDTFNEDSYRMIRRPKVENASLRQVLSNITQAVFLKNKIGSPIQIGLKVCVCRENLKDIRKNVYKARDLGVDSIQIKLARHSIKGALPKSIIKQLERELTWCKNNISDIVILGSMNMPRINHKCWLSPCHIFIDTTGDVRICCYYQFREKEHTYGNIFKDSAEKVWFGKKHYVALEKIKVRECNKWDCKYFVYNNSMKEALISDKAQWQFV